MCCIVWSIVKFLLNTASVLVKLHLHFCLSPESNLIQLTFKYEKQTFVFDGISSKARCSDLLPRLTALLGSGIPANVRLMQNGRFIRMHQTIEEVRQRQCKSRAHSFACCKAVPVPVFTPQ
jgi:hypothetical protein